MPWTGVNPSPTVAVSPVATPIPPLTLMCCLNPAIRPFPDTEYEIHLCRHCNVIRSPLGSENLTVIARNLEYDFYRLTTGRLADPGPGWRVRVGKVFRIGITALADSSVALLQKTNSPASFLNLKVRGSSHTGRVEFVDLREAVYLMGDLFRLRFCDGRIVVTVTTRNICLDGQSETLLSPAGVSFQACGFDLVPVIPEVEDSQFQGWMNSIEAAGFVRNVKQQMRRLTLDHVDELLDLRLA
jgi:hypothetical protein